MTTNPPTETVSDCCGAEVLEIENYHKSKKLRSDYKCLECDKYCNKTHPPTEPTVEKMGGESERLDQDATWYSRMGNETREPSRRTYPAS